MAYDIQQVLEVFDSLSSKVKEKLDEQYNNGRIKGSDYANVFNNLMNTILQISIDVPLKDSQIKNQDKDLEIKDKQLEIYNKDLELKDKQLIQMDKEIELANSKVEYTKAQQEFIDRQKKALDDNLLVKAFSFQAQMVQTGLASSLFEEPPTAISNDELMSTYQELKRRAGV
jgi:hypothetical protein